ACGGDPGVLDRFDRYFHAIVIDRFTLFDDPARAIEDEPRDGLELLALREFDPHGFVDVLDVDFALDEYGVVVDDLDGFALAALQMLADDLLDHVLDRDDPLGGAELVDHDGDPEAFVTHLAQEFVDVFRFGNVEGGLNEVAEFEVARLAVVALSHQIPDVDDADHVVEAALRDRKPGVTAVDTGLDRLVDGCVDGHRRHVESGRHHFLGDGVVETEDTLEHLAFVLGDHPLAPAGLDHALDLVAGHIRGLDRRPAARDPIDLPGEVIEED